MRSKEYALMMEDEWPTTVETDLLRQLDNSRILETFKKHTLSPFFSVPATRWECRWDWGHTDVNLEPCAADIKIARPQNGLHGFGQD